MGIAARHTTDAHGSPRPGTQGEEAGLAWIKAEEEKKAAEKKKGDEARANAPAVVRSRGGRWAVGDGWGGDSATCGTCILSSLFSWRSTSPLSLFLSFLPP